MLIFLKRKPVKTKQRQDLMSVLCVLRFLQIFCVVWGGIEQPGGPMSFSSVVLNLPREKLVRVAVFTMGRFSKHVPRALKRG